MSKLKGKVAVITGASKGIGASIAEHLAAAGASVVVNYSSSKAAADKVAANISAKGGKAIAVQGDVSKPADITKLFAETKKAYGKLDILVNNAGVTRDNLLMRMKDGPIVTKAGRLLQAEATNLPRPVVFEVTEQFDDEPGVGEELVGFNLGQGNHPSKCLSGFDLYFRVLRICGVNRDHGRSSHRALLIPGVIDH